MNLKTRFFSIQNKKVFEHVKENFNFWFDLIFTKPFFVFLLNFFFFDMRKINYFRHYKQLTKVFSITFSNRFQSYDSILNIYMNTTFLNELYSMRNVYYVHLSTQRQRKILSWQRKIIWWKDVWRTVHSNIFFISDHFVFYGCQFPVILWAELLKPSE